MDDNSKIWARTSTQQQCLIFLAVFLLALVLLTWATRGV
jgi:hypothetical protein